MKKSLMARDLRPYRVDVGPYARALKQLALDEDKSPRDLLWEILGDDEKIAERMGEAEEDDG